jgi:hypothetical protein
MEGRLRTLLPGADTFLWLHGTNKDNESSLFMVYNENLTTSGLKPFN